MTESLSSNTFSYDDVEYVIKCDAGFNKNQCTTAYIIEEIISENTVQKENKTFPNIKKTTQAELLAVKQGLKNFVDEYGKKHSIIIKTDYKDAISKIQQTENSIAKDIKQILADLNSWMIIYVNRNALSDVHKLTQSTQNNECY